MCLRSQAARRRRCRSRSTALDGQGYIGRKNIISRPGKIFHPYIAAPGQNHHAAGTACPRSWGKRRPASFQASPVPAVPSRSRLESGIKRRRPGPCALTPAFVLISEYAVTVRPPLKRPRRIEKRRRLPEPLSAVTSAYFTKASMCFR